MLQDIAEGVEVNKMQQVFNILWLLLTNMIVINFMSTTWIYHSWTCFSITIISIYYMVSQIASVVFGQQNWGVPFLTSFVLLLPVVIISHYYVYRNEISLFLQQ